MNNRRLTRVSNGRQLVIAMGAALTLMIPSITAITADADEATGTEVSFSMYAPSVEDVTSIGDVTYVTFDNGQSVELNAQDFAAWTDTQQAIAYYNGHIQVGGGPITQGYDEKVGLCGKSWVQIEAKEWGSRWQSFWGLRHGLGSRTHLRVLGTTISGAPATSMVPAVQIESGRGITLVRAAAQGSSS